MVGKSSFYYRQRGFPHTWALPIKHIEASFVESKGRRTYVFSFYEGQLGLAQPNRHVGMIVTKSAAEGDSRLVGLGYLLRQGINIRLGLNMNSLARHRQRNCQFDRHLQTGLGLGSAAQWKGRIGDKQ